MQNNANTWYACPDIPRLCERQAAAVDFVV